MEQWHRFETQFEAWSETGVTLHGDVHLHSLHAFALEGEPKDVLTSIANPRGLVWWTDEQGDFSIATRRYFERNTACGHGGTQKVFRAPGHNMAQEAECIGRFLKDEELALIVADWRTERIIVNASPQGLAKLTDYLDRRYKSPFALPRRLLNKTFGPQTVTHLKPVRVTVDNRDRARANSLTPLKPAEKVGG